MSSNTIKFKIGYMERAEYDKWISAGVGVMSDGQGDPLCDMGPDDVEDVTFLLPGKNEVCSECAGDGKHPNRDIDGNGITQSEWAEWDQDDRETYMSGGYDVTCTACHGNKVMLCLDEKAFEAFPDFVQKRVYGDPGDDGDYYDAEDEAERRYFAGWG